jgi:hypothetical protein
MWICQLCVKSWLCTPSINTCFICPSIDKTAVTVICYWILKVSISERYPANRSQRWMNLRRRIARWTCWRLTYSNKSCRSTRSLNCLKLHMLLKPAFLLLWLSAFDIEPTSKKITNIMKSFWIRFFLFKFKKLGTSFQEHSLHFYIELGTVNYLYAVQIERECREISKN